MNRSPSFTGVLYLTNPNLLLVRIENSGQLFNQQSKALDDTGSLYQSKASQKSPFMAAGSATQSTLGNTSNLKGKLSSLEVSYNLI